MRIADRLLAFLRKKEKGETKENEAPEGICPNCWGKQEYGGKFYEAVRNYDVDINSHNPKKGWVEQYAEKSLLNIELKQEGEGYVCKTCKLTYRPT